MTFHNSRFPRLSLLIASVFLATTTITCAFSLSMMASSSSRRVVVVGGGIQGTSVAYHLAERGAKVTLLEAKAPGKCGKHSYQIHSACFMFLIDRFLHFPAQPSLCRVRKRRWIYGEELGKRTDYAVA